MKKTFYLIAILFGCITFSNAQVTFKPGFRAGLNISHFSKGDDAYYNDGYTNDRDFGSITNFYIGFFGDLKLSKFYSLQPEINYSRQGSKFEYYDGGLMRNRTENLEVSYLAAGIANKFTFKKINVHVGPTIEFLVDQNFDTDADIDLAFFLGLGYDITPNFGIETRIKKGIIPVLDFSDGNHTNVVFSLGAFYKFDVK
jgi:hypothetical protein